MAERQYLDRDRDLHALGVRRDRAGDGERRREIGALRRKVDLGQPHHIEAPALGGVDLSHRLVKHLRLAASRHRRKFVKHAEFHARAPSHHTVIASEAKQSRADGIPSVEIASSLRSSQ